MQPANKITLHLNQPANGTRDSNRHVTTLRNNEFLDLDGYVDGLKFLQQHVGEMHRQCFDQLPTVTSLAKMQQSLSDSIIINGHTEIVICRCGCKVTDQLDRQ